MIISVNYVTSNFKYPILAPIIGKPTNKTLKQLKQELRANSSNFYTNLGFGDHGYLKLLLTDVEYAQILLIPTLFVAPAWSSTLAFNPTATTVEAAHAK